MLGLYLALRPFDFLSFFQGDKLPFSQKRTALASRAFNQRAHHASRIEEVAEDCGAEVLWLAPYSPDFSPIELRWSKIKARLRVAKARTREELERALVLALELVTGTGCRGWFKHCGYQVARNRN